MTKRAFDLVDLSDHCSKKEDHKCACHCYDYNNEFSPLHDNTIMSMFAINYKSKNAQEDGNFIFTMFGSKDYKDHFQNLHMTNFFVEIDIQCISCLRKDLFCLHLDIYGQPIWKPEEIILDALAKNTPILVAKKRLYLH